MFVVCTPSTIDVDDPTYVKFYLRVLDTGYGPPIGTSRECPGISKLLAHHPKSYQAEFLTQGLS